MEDQEANPTGPADIASDQNTLTEAVASPDNDQTKPAVSDALRMLVAASPEEQARILTPIFGNARVYGPNDDRPVYRIKTLRADVDLREILLKHRRFKAEIIYRDNADQTTTRSVVVQQLHGTREGRRALVYGFSAYCNTIGEHRNFMANNRLLAARVPGGEWQEGPSAARMLLLALARQHR